MKLWQKIGIAVGVVVLIVLSFIVTNNGDVNTPTLSNDPETIINNAQEESALVKENEVKEPIQIDVDKYLEYKAGSEAKLILLARPTCGYCNIAEPIINNIAYEYAVEVNYLNTDEFTEESQVEFVQSDEAFSDGFGTPYLFVVKDGEIIDAVDGLTDHAHYIDFLQRNGFIE